MNDVVAHAQALEMTPAQLFISSRNGNAFAVGAVRAGREKRALMLRAFATLAAQASLFDARAARNRQKLRVALPARRADSDAVTFRNDGVAWFALRKGGIHTAIVHVQQGLHALGASFGRLTRCCSSCARPCYSRRKSSILACRCACGVCARYILCAEN